MRLTLGVVVAVAAAGCQFNTVQRQVGLVPPPRPVAFDGQPMNHTIRFEGRASRSMVPFEPSSQPTNNAAYVSREQIGGGVLVRVRGGAALGAAVDYSRSAGAAPMADALDEPLPEKSAYTVAFVARHSIPASASVSIGLACDLGWTRVPLTVDDTSGSDLAGLYRIAIVPSWRSGPLALFGGFHLTNDTIVPAHTTLKDDLGGTAEANALIAIATAGASIHLDNGLAITTQVAQPFGGDDRHGLQLDVTLAAELGD